MLSSDIANSILFATLCSFLFLAGGFAPETGLSYYGARYYDPALSKFTQSDPIVSNPYDPQNLNRYSYCRNNPLIYIDPTGNEFIGLMSATSLGSSVWPMFSSGMDWTWNSISNYASWSMNIFNQGIVQPAVGGVSDFGSALGQGFEYGGE